jgi:hypothetical protein
VDDAASREYQPPPFVTREITGELAFSGAALAVPGAPAA